MKSQSEKDSIHKLQIDLRCYYFIINMAEYGINPPPPQKKKKQQQKNKKETV